MPEPVDAGVFYGNQDDDKTHDYSITENKLGGVGAITKI